MPLRKTLERVRASTTPPNEEAAKITILVPLLQDLGWDVWGGTEVRFEYSAGGKSKGGRVDIALMNPRAQGNCVAFVEAKAPRVNLGDHVEQILGYAFHNGVSVCILTTGEEWWLYLPLEKGPPQDRRFAELNLLSDPIEQLVDDFQAFLGKEVLCNGQAERRAEQVLKARRRASQLNIELPRIWQQMKDEPDSELVELVGKRVYKAVGLRPEPSQVADVLAGTRVRPAPTAAVSAPTQISEPTEPLTRPAPTAAVSAPTQISEPRQPLIPRYRQPAEAPKRHGRGYATPIPNSFILWGQHHQINYWYELLVGVAAALYERHPNDFERLKEQTRGKKHPLISRDPSELRMPKRIGTSIYWINVAFSSKNIKRYSERLLEYSGYNPSDLELVFD